MAEELKEILIILLKAAVFGSIIGITLRKLKPEWAKSFAKSSLNRKWWLFTIGLLLFTGLSIIAFLQGNPYYGIFFTILTLSSVYLIFKYGFKELTPEQEAFIDASDPSKLRPFSFWKYPGSGDHFNAKDADKANH